MSTSPSNRQRLLMILAGAAVLLLVLDSLVLTPLTKGWQSRRAEIAKLQKNVTEGRAMIERATRTRAVWAEMQSQALPKEAAKADASCGIAHWGVARTWYHPIWAPPSPDELRQGTEAIGRALTAGAKTERERDYISALTVFYKD